MILLVVIVAFALIGGGIAGSLGAGVGLLAGLVIGGFVQGRLDQP
jgi:hypothetical protein